VSYHSFLPLWNAHSSTEWNENFNESRTLQALAAVNVSALHALSVIDLSG
jgi:hypothetical protein